MSTFPLARQMPAFNVLEARMPLLSVVLVLIVIGVALWLVNTYIPMAPPIKTVINVLVILVLCIWLLGLFGIGDIYVGRHVR